MAYEGPEKRSTSVDQLQTFYSAIAKIENVPGQINSLKDVMTVELSALRGDLKNLEEKIYIKVNTITEKLNDHCDEGEEINELLNAHDRKIEKAKDYIQEIENLKSRVKHCEDELDVIKNTSKELVYDVVTKVAKKLGSILLMVIGFAILFAIFNPTFWSEMFGRINV